MHKKKVLFVCINNSARSQMAEGLLRALKGDIYDVESAGIAPTQVDPDAIRAMEEIGIDIAGQRSKGFDGLKDEKFDIIVTLCGSTESCPAISGVHIHRGFPDPAASDEVNRIDAFRRVRDEIRRWIEDSF